MRAADRARGRGRECANRRGTFAGAARALGLHSVADAPISVDGDLTPSIVRRYGLADAPQAHRDLVSHRTTGKLLLP
jgi:NADPH:quinone reductase-like Zn-dependent oxidoreductase